MNKICFLFFFLTALASASNLSVEKTMAWKLSSPDSKINCQIQLNESGQLSYQIFSKKRGKKLEIIESSPLGLIRTDQKFDVFQFESVQKVIEVKENYALKTGKQLQNTNHYKELTLHFQNGRGSKINLVFRAYNDGVAFKYLFPEVNNNSFTITKELSGFDLPQDGLAWIQPYDKPSDYSPAYEKNYEKGFPVTKSAPTIDGWAFPALFQVKNHWLLLTEANLNNNFYGSHLNQDTTNGLYTLAAPNQEEALGYGSNLATSTLPWNMPWRVIYIGSQLSEIVESNLVYHLSDASAIKDTSWIKAGRSSWAWWSGYIDKSSDTPEKLKRFIDFSKTMNWEYSLVDAGWESRKGLNIAELVDYAKSKNVDLLLWYNSGGPTNKVDAGPRDLMFKPELRKKEMKRIAELGIKGIKIDFFGSDKQALIQLYLDILKDAAKHKLLVNFHGCTLPRGWSRTYPNLVSMEAVKGSEGYIYHSDFENEAPAHNTILPFTRNVVGPMDYTPTAFSLQQYRHKTTAAHELATSLVFESGIQHYPDTPESYLSNPKEVLDFLKNLPAIWDITKFLSGYPAKDIVISRKSQQDWFVGGLNGEDFSKEIEIDFSFLDNGNYNAQIISDGENNSSFKISNVALTKKSKIKVKMSPFGGFVIRIKNNK